MAASVGLALLDVNIFPFAANVGLTIFLLVTAGVMLGRVLGAAVGKRAEIGATSLIVEVQSVLHTEKLTFMRD